jgi:hypothetical protein
MESYVRNSMVRPITMFAAFAAVVITCVLLIAFAGVISGCGADLKSPERYADPCGQNADCMDFCANEASSALSTCTEPYGCYNVRTKLEAGNCATAWRAHEKGSETTASGARRNLGMRERRTGDVKAWVKQDGTALLVKVSPECAVGKDNVGPCASSGAAKDIPVVLIFNLPDGRSQPIQIGATNESGLLKVDLDAVFSPGVVVFPPTASVGCGPFASSLPYGGPVGCDISNFSELLQIDMTPLASIRDDRLWVQSNADACRTPTAADSCAGIRKYLAIFKGVGRHSDDAANIMKQAMPTLTSMADEKRWSGVDLEACRSYSGTDPEGVNQTCTPVNDYLKTFPNGAHADLARDALAKGQRIHDQLVARAAAAERQEQAAELARQRADAARRRAQCPAVCRMQCSSKLHFDECFAGCLQLCAGQ